MPGCSKDPQVESERRKKLSTINRGRNKGKTYEELYGVERAAALRKLRSDSIKSETWNSTRGKTLEQILGSDRASGGRLARRRSHEQEKLAVAEKLKIREQEAKQALAIDPDSRYTAKFWEWQNSVFVRDDRTCRSCGKPNLQGNDCHAHHIFPWSYFPLLRYDIDNGLTLCASCHVKETNWEISLKKSGALITGVSVNEFNKLLLRR